jgi:hypothetical protein
MRIRVATMGETACSLFIILLIFIHIAPFVLLPTYLVYYQQTFILFCFFNRTNDNKYRYLW